MRVDTRAETELWPFGALAAKPYRGCILFTPAGANGRPVAGLRWPARSPPPNPQKTARSRTWFGGWDSVGKTYTHQLVCGADCRIAHDVVGTMRSLAAEPYTGDYAIALRFDCRGFSEAMVDMLEEYAASQLDKAYSTDGWDSRRM